ncbi:thrombospondin type 3 repeat-containing protein [Patescibacteria group bacterium]|nr:thrombospondin type 3 repeat-containing protein [Patescibacteria group bacterium]
MNTKNHSRKISLFVAVFILLTGVFLGGYLVLKSGKVSAGQLGDILKGNSVNPAVCEPNAGDANKDSDNDGLKDWQEIQIYQSDPCKIDTDNDGYLDGEEVTSGYNPIIKAPGDELPGTLPKGPRPLPENLTTALSSMLSQQITTGKIESFTQEGRILSAAELEKYPGLQQSVRQIMFAGDQLFAAEAIDESQIKITNNNSRAEIQRYAGEAAAAFPPAENDGENEATLFLNAMQNNDFSKIDKNLEIYQTAYKKLQVLSVPSDLLEIHKEQLNIISGLIKVYQAIKDIDVDPLKTNLALQKYSYLTEQLTNWFQKLAAFINARQQKTSA